MMGKFLATNKTRECPVCYDTSGKCRSKEGHNSEGEKTTFYLCVAEADTKRFDTVNGYLCISGGKSRWATFVLDREQSQPTKAERQQQRQAREAEQKAQQALYQAGLSTTERHVAHSKVLQQLSLHSVDRADLERRGLSAQKVNSFRSIERWQELDTPVSHRTPGCDGKKLLTPYSGYLVPCRDLSGHITAFQIRNRYKRKKEDPKYPWLSTYSRPAKLRNAEMPLTFAPGEGKVVYLCEGILKPEVAAERLGVRFIGASGGMFASSPKQFKQWVRKLVPTELVLCPDGGAITNPDVMREYWKLWKLTANVGHSLKIQWWGQETKDDDDIDEITLATFAASELIDWSAFLAKVPEDIRQRLERQFGETSAASPSEKKKNRCSKAEWEKQQRIARDRKAYASIAELLSLDVDIDTDEDDYQTTAKTTLYEPLKRHLKYEAPEPIVGGFASELIPSQANSNVRSLLAYDCSQGTGKSNNALIPAALRTVKAGGRVLIVVPTRGLAREFKGRINDRAGDTIAATHLDSNYYSAQIVVTCPESTYKFKGQHFDLIQIDEANEVLHRIESAELGNAGPQSLSAFRQLLASTQTVAIATAAMSGWTLAAVQAIGGFTSSETQVQRRARPATRMSVIEYSNYYQWLQRIIDSLRSGLRVAIPTGSQGRGRTIDRVLRSLFPDKTGLVIDGKATMQNQRSKFLADPDAFLTIEQPNWFIFTPVINSGVSIEGQHFDIQFEYATPHEGAQSVSQRGERVRSAIGRDGAIKERHIYFSRRGAPTLEAHPKAFDWRYWVEELADELNAPMGAAAALAKALGAQKALSPMQQDADKFSAMRPHLSHFLALKAFEIIYKRELLREDWQCYGWQLYRAPEPDKKLGKQLQELATLSEKIKIGLIKQRGRTLKKARTRETDSDTDEVSNPFQAARVVKLQLEKLLGKKYLSQQDSQFHTAWVADKSASNPGVRSVVRSQLLAIAVSDPDCFEQIERMKALKFLAGKPDMADAEFWRLPELPAAAKDIELVSIISRCPGVADVVRGELVTWTNADPQVIAAGLYLIAHAKQIAANTRRKGLMKGAKFSDQMAPAALFNKALELVGYIPQKQKRQGSGARLNVYRLRTQQDVVQAVEKLKQREATPMELFRAELQVIRAKSRSGIESAIRVQIVRKALVWVDQTKEQNIRKAILAIKKRHSDLNISTLTKLGDDLKVDDLSLLSTISKKTALIDLFDQLDTLDIGTGAVK